MRFFPEREPPPPPPRRRRVRRDGEHHRPTLVLPSYLAADVVLARSDRAALVMHAIACYPQGFAFSLEATSRYDTFGEDADREGPFSLFSSTPSARFGLAYSDGRRATLDQEAVVSGLNGPANEIRLVLGGGEGSEGYSTTELWVHPLPPNGPVTFAVEWPSQGIEETLHVIEGERFREAAERATPVFPRRRARRD